MKIALLGTRGIPACYSGYETFYENIAVRLAGRGHEVTVYNRKQYIDYPHRYFKGVRLITLPTIRSKHLDTLFHTFISIIHAAFQSYDIAYFCIVGNSPLTILTRLLGIKTLLNVDGEDYKRDKWRGFAKKYLKWCEKIATIFPHLIIADSQVIRKRYFEAYKKKTVFVPYGADIVRNDDVSWLDRFGLERRGYILFVGRLVPENRAHLLIQAFNQLHTEFKLVIVGDAPYTEGYQKELRRMAKANQNIILTGYLFGDGYRSLSSHCYLFALPSGVDGTRPALLEQMAFGSCVLVNNSPANREVIGEAGFSFDGSEGPGDLVSKLKHLLHHPELVEEHGSKAMKRVEEKYSWNAVTDEYEKLFKTLVQGAAIFRAKMNNSDML